MILNQIILAWRVIKRNSVTSVIHIASLSLALAVSLLTLLFIWHELSFDRHHVNSERIYRLTSHFEARGRQIDSATSAGALTNIIKAEVAIVESVTRLYSYGWREAALFESRDDSFYEQSFYLADTNY
ncbi:hypothetical protein KAR48_14305, partial [bacterium]|nr:hypothetical protein [bacterium]